MSRIVSSWLLMGIFLASCAPKPILYPNQHYKDAGRDAADQAIEECSQMAKDAGATPSRGKTGQVAGSTAGVEQWGQRLVRLEEQSSDMPVAEQWSEPPVARRRVFFEGCSGGRLPARRTRSSCNDV